MKSNIPEVLQISVKLLIFQELTLDEVVAQAKLRHGQYLGFVRWGVARRAHQVIPLLSTGDALTAHHNRGHSS